jgi:hypothetical protein
MFNMEKYINKQIAQMKKSKMMLDECEEKGYMNKIILELPEDELSDYEYRKLMLEFVYDAKLIIHLYFV